MGRRATLQVVLWIEAGEEHSEFRGCKHQCSCGCHGRRLVAGSNGDEAGGDHTDRPATPCRARVVSRPSLTLPNKRHQRGPADVFLSSFLLMSSQNLSKSLESL